MKYFFIPGRLPNLSWKELNSVCETFFKPHEYIIKKNPEYFFLDIDLNIDFLFKRLGGFIKYGILLDDNWNVEKLIENQSEKIIFGLSNYTSRYSFKDIQKLSKDLKKEIAKLNHKARFILPREDNFLNAGQILKNDILKNGFELVMFENGFGKTLDVQNIDDFTIRDYEKPFVDTKMGVLPVKLARMMINYAGIEPNSTLWDPFCGSGNILLEGLDLNYNVIGSDIDEKALEGSKKNINWANDKYGYEVLSKVFFFDVLNPSKSKTDILKNLNVDAIVCEPYMGEAQRKVLTVGKANILTKNHLNLVKNLFSNLKLIGFKKNIRLVIIFPEYKTKEGWISIDRGLCNFENFKLIYDEDLHWSRKDSIIKRLIFIFDCNFK